MKSFFENYFLKISRFEPVKGFQARVVQSRINDMAWAIIEWEEGQDRDVLAIFEDNVDLHAPRSYLMQFGEGTGWRKGKRWCQSRLTWQVRDFTELKNMLVFAQHTLGLLQLSDMDIFTLYRKDTNSECSDEQ